MSVIIEFIAWLRGGQPSKCDFCGDDVTLEDAVPEEAGQWACMSCFNRFEEQDKRERSGVAK